MKIAVIGFGNMGSAIVRSWLKNSMVSSGNLALFDSERSKLHEGKLAETELASSSSPANERLAQADLILLAVKPQDLEAVAREFKDTISDKTIILSILAGVSVERLKTVFGRSGKIVRAMPNLAARVCRSVTGYVTTDDLQAQEAGKVRGLLDSFGVSHQLDSEELLDSWCALCGSGPGFVFSLMECFYEAAKKQGFDPELASFMVRNTFFGAAVLARNSSDSLATLKADVSSKGGTTEAGLSVLESARMQETIIKAVHAAENRSKQLNLL